MTDQERVLFANEATQTETTAQIAQGTHLVNEQEVIRLHEERAKVEVHPEQRGAVVIRKIVTERQEMVPVTLLREYLEITVAQGAQGAVLLDGQPLEVGRAYEVTLREERAQVTKEVYAIQDVNIRKVQQQETHRAEVVLRREELDIQGDTQLVHEVGDTRR